MTQTIEVYVQGKRFLARTKAEVDRILKFFSRRNEVEELKTTITFQLLIARELEKAKHQNVLKLFELTQGNERKTHFRVASSTFVSASERSALISPFVIEDANLSPRCDHETA